MRRRRRGGDPLAAAVLRSAALRARRARASAAGVSTSTARPSKKAVIRDFNSFAVWAAPPRTPRGAKPPSPFAPALTISSMLRMVSPFISSWTDTDRKGRRGDAVASRRRFPSSTEAKIRAERCRRLTLLAPDAELIRAAGEIDKRLRTNCCIVHGVAHCRRIAFGDPHRPRERKFRRCFGKGRKGRDRRQDMEGQYLYWASWTRAWRERRRGVLRPRSAAWRPCARDRRQGEDAR